MECLWHEAHLLHLQQPDAMAQQLTDRAGRLCRALRSSNAYAAAELRGYTAKRIGGDEELREVVEGVDSRLFEALIEAIRSPHEGTTDD